MNSNKPARYTGTVNNSTRPATANRPPSSNPSVVILPTEKQHKPLVRPVPLTKNLIRDSKLPSYNTPIPVHKKIVVEQDDDDDAINDHDKADELMRECDELELGELLEGLEPIKKTAEEDKDEWAEYYKMARGDTFGTSANNLIATQRWEKIDDPLLSVIQKVDVVILLNTVLNGILNGPAKYTMTPNIYVETLSCKGCLTCFVSHQVLNHSKDRLLIVVCTLVRRHDGPACITMKMVFDSSFSDMKKLEQLRQTELMGDSFLLDHPAVLLNAFFEIMNIPYQLEARAISL